MTPTDQAAAPRSAGAGRAVIRLPAALLPFDDFTSVHDDLLVRVVLVDDGESRVAIVAVEMTSLSPEDAAWVRRRVGEVAAVEEDRVVVAATHTFSAPHLLPAGTGTSDQRARSRLLRDALEGAVDSAAREAGAAMRPARLVAGLGTSRIGVNRNVETADGWWLGANESGATDPDVPVLIIRSLDGQPIAVLAACSVQSSVMNESDEGGGARSITGDLAGAAARFVEERYDHAGTVVLVLTGAAGDQAPYLTSRRNVLDRDGRPFPVDAGTAGHLLVSLLGERLGSEICSVVESPGHDAPGTLAVERHDVVVDGQQAPTSFRDLSPSRSYAFAPGEQRIVPFWLVRLGPVLLVGLQAELSATTGARLRAALGAEHAMVATMVNGSAKYLPAAASYALRTYDAMSSRYAEGAAEVVVAEIVSAAERPILADR